MSFGLVAAVLAMGAVFATVLRWSRPAPRVPTKQFAGAGSAGVNHALKQMQGPNRYDVVIVVFSSFSGVLSIMAAVT
ncbi:hypothetical protein ACEUEL_03875 [Ancylobacter sp. sgz301288]